MLSDIEIQAILISLRVAGIALVTTVVVLIPGLEADDGEPSSITGWIKLALAVLLLLALFFVPESPRFLCRKGRIDHARAVFTRIDGPEHAGREIAEIEASLRGEGGALRELLRPGLPRLLLLGVAIAQLLALIRSVQSHVNALEDFFGESFARAYEEQIRKLRPNNNNS